MTAWQWIVAVHLAAWAAVAVLAWRHWRASRHTAGVEDGQGRQTGDPTAVADAVTQPRPVLTVHRLHTGALDYSTSELTVSEAITVGERCIQAALNVQWRQSGIHLAEHHANGEQA